MALGEKPAPFPLGLFLFLSEENCPGRDDGALRRGSSDGVPRLRATCCARSARCTECGKGATILTPAQRLVVEALRRVRQTVCCASRSSSWRLKVTRCCSTCVPAG